MLARYLKEATAKPSLRTKGCKCLVARPDEHQRNDDGQGDEQLFGESNRYVNDIDLACNRSDQKLK